MLLDFGSQVCQLEESRELAGIDTDFPGQGFLSENWAGPSLNRDGDECIKYNAFIMSVFGALLLAALPLAAEPVLDGHFHVVSSEQWKESHGFDNPIGVSEIFAQLDQAGAEKAVLLSAAFLFMDRKKAAFENDYVAKLVREHPQRLIGYCAVHLGASWAPQEVKRCVKKLGLSGIKLHLKRNKLLLTDEKTQKRFRRVLDAVKEMKTGLPILVDFDWLDPRVARPITELAFSYPEVNIVIAHAFGTNFRQLELPASFYLIKPKTPRNIWVDISIVASLYAGSSEEESLLWHLRQIGPERIVFGSDYPVLTTEQAVTAVKKLRFTDDERAGVLGGNLSRLLQLTPR